MNIYSVKVILFNTIWYTTFLRLNQSLLYNPLASSCAICLNELIMELVLDLHLHSRFSRAVSQRMNLYNMYLWAQKKGIDILTISDFTHPIWFKEAKANLEEESPGVYALKNRENTVQGNGQQGVPLNDPRFVLSVEVASIYSENLPAGRQGAVVHKIHNLIFAPSFEVAERINREFLRHGFNLSSDGRPILGISSRNLAELLFSIDQNIMLIPCHAWTPWFSLYGSRSGYDSINDCFGSYSKYIYAIETGLSSDPSMNWRIKELENRSIVSFSDAHSPENMGREATVLAPRKNGNSKYETRNTKLNQFSYEDLLAAFKRDAQSRFEIAYTIEFYPEEGKYHYTGHRLCGISYSPRDAKEKGTICPVCKRPLTVGVMDRVEELAGISEDTMKFEKDEHGVIWAKDKNGVRPSYVSLVPLLEIVREATSTKSNSANILSLYDALVSAFGSEYAVLLRTPLSEIQKVAGGQVATAVEKVRLRNLFIEPGFDGEYGKVRIPLEDASLSQKSEEKTQLGFGF